MSNKPQRNEKGHYLKGVSGNPGGTAKGLRGVAQKLQRDTGNGQELYDFLLSVMRNEFEEMGAGMLSDSEKFNHRKWATEKLLDRVLGKAKETVEVISSFDEGGSATAIDTSSMSDEELEALAKAGDILEKHAALKAPIDV
jgi:hypothetical protein